MTQIIAFLASFLLTTICFPLTIKFAKKYGLVDDPNTRPHPAHIQKRIIPRAGGLAIFLGISLISLLFLPIEKHLIGILLGSSLLLITGLLDDKLKNFNPYFRLGLLFAAAAIAVGSGIGISFITNPLYGFEFLPIEINTHYLRLDQVVFPVSFFGEHNILILADLFAFILIVSLTQIINWSKGVDGQMPGISLITALTIGFLSLKLYLGGDPNQLNLANLAFITAGASLSLLIFNWYPSKILPGFSGSTILAFILANLAILSGAKVATLILVLAIPTIDFVYLFFKRISKGKSPVWGDKDHLHHHLLDLGYSHRQIALFYILVSAILGTVAIIVDTRGKFFGVLVVAAIFIGFILFINSFKYKKE